MRILYKPRVYLVGRPSACEEGIAKFLDEQGLEWPTPIEGVEDAARLTELMGRSCYMSYGVKAGSKTNQKYIDNLLGRTKDGEFRPGPAHGCYDSETEVLTKAGWKRWEHVSEYDEFATRTDLGYLEYHKPNRLIRYHHKGDMYRVESQGVDLLVTPDHKMLVCPTTTVEGRKKRNFELITAQELGHRSHAYVKDAIWVPKDEIRTPDGLPELLGFAIGDGSMTTDCRAVKFRLRRPRKIAFLRTLLCRVGWDVSENERHDCWRVHIPNQWLPLFRDMYDESREKRIPRNVFTSWDIEQLHGVYHGLIQSDGHESRTGVCFDSTSRQLLNDFQQLCLHIGLAANEGYTLSGEDRNSYGDKDLTRMHVIHRSLRPVVNKYGGQKGRTYWVQDWSGEVFCADVPNHTLYVRRNGIPVWSGNSVLEHVYWNFMVVGSGRGFSHELVRHRVGTGYSQLSTRYCDFERAEEDGTWEPGFCVPPLAQFSDRTRRLFEEKYKDDQAYYAKVLDSIMRDLRDQPHLMASLDDKTPRERDRVVRKAARGAARDVLPIGTEAIIGFTANARAIWNMAYLRASEHAEGTIRDVFVQVVQIMEEEFPTLFKGIEFEELWDGSVAVKLPRDKL